MTSPEILLFKEVRGDTRFNYSVLKQHNTNDIIDFLKQYFPTTGVHYGWVALMIEADR
jgi:hypothetical protein